MRTSYRRSAPFLNRLAEGMASGSALATLVNVTILILGLVNSCPVTYYLQKRASALAVLGNNHPEVFHPSFLVTKSLRKGCRNCKYPEKGGVGDFTVYECDVVNDH